MNLKDYISYIQTHDAEDLIRLIMDESWKLFHSEDGAIKVSNQDYGYHYLRRAFGDRVASIAFAFDTNQGKWKVTRLDLSQMLQMYLEISESLTSNPFEGHKERDLEILSKFSSWNRFSSQIRH
jgi:hypothetical protein